MYVFALQLMVFIPRRNHMHTLCIYKRARETHYLSSKVAFASKLDLGGLLLSIEGVSNSKKTKKCMLRVFLHRAVRAMKLYLASVHVFHVCACLLFFWCLWHFCRDHPECEISVRIFVYGVALLASRDRHTQQPRACSLVHV